MSTKSEVYTTANLDCIMRGLECANPALAAAYDVLRIALGIEEDAPKTVWHTSRMPNRIGVNK